MDAAELIRDLSIFTDIDAELAIRRGRRREGAGPC